MSPAQTQRRPNDSRCRTNAPSPAHGSLKLAMPRRCGISGSTALRGVGKKSRARGSNFPGLRLLIMDFVAAGPNFFEHAWRGIPGEGCMTQAVSCLVTMIGAYLIVAYYLNYNSREAALIAISSLRSGRMVGSTRVLEASTDCAEQP
jgi:hypothetical protein